VIKDGAKRFDLELRQETPQYYYYEGHFENLYNILKWNFVFYKVTKTKLKQTLLKKFEKRASRVKFFAEFVLTVNLGKFPPAGIFIDFELFGLKISLSATVQELEANIRNRRGARATVVCVKCRCCQLSPDIGFITLKGGIKNRCLASLSKF
jgi:hypothetical protein